MASSSRLFEWLKPPPRLFIIDFDLIDYAGHFFNQALGFREAALQLGLKPQIYCNVTVRPDVATLLDAKAILPRMALREEDFDVILHSFVEAELLLQPLWASLHEQGVRDRDIVLITSARVAVVHAATSWLSLLPPDSRPAMFFRSFAYEFVDPKSGDLGAPAAAYRYLFARIASSPGRDRVFFTINDIALAAKLRELGGPMHYLPVPKYYGDKSAPLLKEATDRWTVYVHVNRLGEMPARVAAAVRAIGKRRRDVSFLIRCKQPGGADVFLDALGTKQSGDQIELLPDEDTDEAFLAVIARSDIVLLPYDAGEYRGLPSGPFCEAAALGKVAVVPADTWMAEQIADGRAAGVTFANSAADEMVEALERALDDAPRLQQSAIELAPAFRREHSCLRNLELMHDLAFGRGAKASAARVIDFTARWSSPYLLSGWGEIDERVGVWTVGEQAELLLPSPLIAPTLRFDVCPCLVPEQPTLKVSIEVEGVPVTSWLFNLEIGTGWSYRDLVLPDNFWSRSQLRVTFRIDNPVRPSEMGLSSDTRALGLMVRTMEAHQKV